MPDDVLQFHIQEPQWPMRLQHATEKRDRYKYSGSYPSCHDFGPGKDRFFEKSVGFENYRFLILPSLSIAEERF